jgi:hypothetical protein
LPASLKVVLRMVAPDVVSVWRTSAARITRPLMQPVMTTISESFGTFGRSS